MVSPSPCKSPPPSRQAERLLTLRKTRLSFLRKSLSSLKIRISTLDFTYFPKRKTRLFTFLFRKAKIFKTFALGSNSIQFRSLRDTHIPGENMCFPPFHSIEFHFAFDFHTCPGGRAERGQPSSIQWDK